MLILIGFILISIYLSYRSKVNNCPYNWKKLSLEELNTLGIALISDNQKGLFTQYLYHYKNVEISVYRRKGSLQVIIGEIDIQKNNKFICHYSDLPLSFKSELFKCYSRIKFSPYYFFPVSKSRKCKRIYQKNISTEHLYNFEGSVK